MTRTIKTLLLVVLPLTTWAQQDSLWNKFPVFFDSPFRTVKANSMVAIEGNYFIDASTANNALLWKLGLQDDLSKELIDENAGRVKAKNMIGIDSRFSLTYYNLNKAFMKHDSLHYLIRYGVIDHAGASYSDDFFRLIGQGNAVFEGDTANGNGLVFKRARFDYIDFGLIKFFPNRSNLSVAVGIARGMRMIDMDGRRFSVYTAPYGTSTDWDIDLTARLTPGDHQGLASVNGMGMQISAEYKGLLGADGAYAVGVRNLGFIAWKGSEYTKTDKFTYDGWDVPDFGTFQDPDAGRNSYDSIASEFQPDSTGFKSTEMLPGYIYGEYSMRLMGKQSLTFRFDKVLNTPMVPRVSVGYTYFFGNFYGTSSVMTGGYSSFNITQEVGFQKGKHFVKAKFYGIQAWATPHKSGGMGGGLGYTYSF